VRTTDPKEVTVVPATEDEREFSYQVKKAAEGAYIAAIWGWDEDFQRAFHAKEWQERRPDVILYQGTRVGTIYVREEEGILLIRQFFLLPAYQNRGIGSQLLRRAMALADSQGLVSRVAFLQGNRVESLYRRFGFRSTTQRDHYCFMERVPAEGSPQAAAADADKPRSEG
jgi:GNAT superfamily N-acetyltransferase